MADNPDLKNDPNSPRNRAIETLQRIPVAGLEDLLKAKFDPEIWMWRVVLLLSIAVTIRYNVELTKTFLKYSTVEDFQLVVPEEAPFPFVYICAQHAINRTYATSTFPLELVKKVIQTKPHGAAATMLRTNEVSVEAFQEELLKFLSFRAIEEVKFDERLMYAYAEVLDEAIEKLGDQWPGWTGLLQGSSYQCESVVQECEYNGKPFSCCPIGQNLTSLQEADICFGISPTETFEGRIVQADTGWKKGLRFKIRIDLKDMFDHLIPLTGIRIHFGRVVSRQQNPIIVPVDTSAIVNLRLKNRQLFQDCVEQLDIKKFDDLQLEPEIMEYAKTILSTDVYEPASCTTILNLRMAWNNCGCVSPHDRTLRPSDNRSCTSMHVYHCIHMAVAGLTKIENGEDFLELEKQLERRCLPRCDYWQYEARTSFAVLGWPNHVEKTGVLRNEIVINYGDIEYMIETETRTLTTYQFICRFGTNLGFVLGMSGVTLFQIPIFAFAAYWIMRQARKVVPVVNA